MLDDREGRSKLIFPGLDGFYRWSVPASWLIVRVAAGAILVMHGWPKVLPGPSSFAGRFEELGFPHGAIWAWVDTLIEVVGGACIVLGLFTRFFAAAAAIELATIMTIYLPNGFAWINRGYEFVLMWGLICFAIALRGGGPYSLDRRIGLEL